MHRIQYMYTMQWTRDTEDSPCRLGNGVELGASMLNDVDDGTFVYFAGAGADAKTPTPGCCTRWKLPAGEYVVCRFETENFAQLRQSVIDKAFKYLFETWLPAHGLATEPFSTEKYTDITEAVSVMEIWVKPVPIDK